MFYLIKMLGNPGTARRKLFRKSAGALACALAAVPMSALAVCNDAFLCTTVGTNALVSNTGSSNTANGVQALRFNTTGSANTASGAYALQSNTTGHANTANGVSAL